MKRLEIEPTEDGGVRIKRYNLTLTRIEAIAFHDDLIAALVRGREAARVPRTNTATAPAVDRGAAGPTSEQAGTGL